MQSSPQKIIQVLPLRPQSPDLRNRNKIAPTNVQTTSIKQYLQSKKSKTKIQQPALSSRTLQQHFWYKSQKKPDPYDHQQILRKRIIELELQNNQFRRILKQYEGLTGKNQQLEAKKITLNSQLAISKDLQSINKNIKGKVENSKVLKQQSTIQKKQSEGSSRQMFCSEYMSSPFYNQYPEAKDYHLQTFRQQAISQRLGSSENQNEKLTASNKYIRDYIGEQVIVEVSKLESKFLGYLQRIERQLQQIKESEIVFQDRAHIKHSEQKKDIENSLVNIELENISESQHSFGKSNKPRNSKIANLSFEKVNYDPQIEISPQLKRKLEFTQPITKKVHQSIENLRENLGLLLGQQAKIDGSKVLESENTIFQQLQNLINSFFADRKRQASSLVCYDNFRESLVLRQKMKFSTGQYSQSKNSQNRNQESSQMYKNGLIKSVGVKQKQPAFSERQLQFQLTRMNIEDLFNIAGVIKEYFRKTLIDHKLFVPEAQFC